MASEVRKVLDSYSFFEVPRWLTRLDAAERADAEVRYTVECNRCGQHTCTSGEYPATCGCGTVFRLHRHNQQADDAELRRKIAELVARWSTHYVPIDAAVMVRRLLAELNTIIATKPSASGVTPTTVSYQKEPTPDPVTEKRV